MSPQIPDGWKDLARRRKPWMLPAVAVAGVGVVGLAVLLPRNARARSRAPGRYDGDVDVDRLKGAAPVATYLRAAEDASGIQGLMTFGLAASKRESGWNNMAVNDSENEAAAACSAWQYQRDRKLKTSPYRADRYWCWGTGGWFGQMPAYALARNPFENLNPIWAVHDPATSTAMFTGFVARIVRDYFPDLPPEHRNWLAVRRAMASTKTMADYDEKGERAKGVRKRLAENLQQIGADPSFMYLHPKASSYPGNGEVWARLRGLDPSSLPMA